jgi:alternate signal-mediated exported protein
VSGVAVAGLAIACGCGVFWASGRGTFALWNDSQNVPAGEIEAGDLEIASVGPSDDGKCVPGWQDTSADLNTLATLSGGPTSVSSFLAQPGDRLYLRECAELKLQGDNLASHLVLTPKSGLPAGVTGVQFHTSVVEGVDGVKDGHGDVAFPRDPLATDRPSTTILDIPQLGADPNTEHTVWVAIDLTVHYDDYTAMLADGTGSPVAVPSDESLALYDTHPSPDTGYWTDQARSQAQLGYVLDLKQVRGGQTPQEVGFND